MNMTILTLTLPELSRRRLRKFEIQVILLALEFMADEPLEFIYAQGTAMPHSLRDQCNEVQHAL